MTKITESAGGIVLNEAGQVLIVSQKGLSWSLPKGHLDPGEKPLDAAKREIYEESGISELKLVKDLGFYERFKISLKGGDDSSEMKRIHMFIFRTSQTDLRPLDPDNPEALWLAPEEAACLLTHAKDREFLLKAIQNF
jgi:ADP-ribose pyrophosphatase YjhB (NUDIX family)